MMCNKLCKPVQFSKAGLHIIYYSSSVIGLLYFNKLIKLNIQFL